VAYNGRVMGFVGSSIELCGSVVTNNGEKTKFFCYWCHLSNAFMYRTKPVSCVLLCFNYCL